MNNLDTNNKPPLWGEVGGGSKKPPLGRKVGGDCLLDIKKELRANMNGVASAAMRQSADYRVNWGIEMPRLRDIASEFEPSHELAQALWKEGARECRILATMLMPVDDFDEELCDVWVEDIHTTELAQHFCLNLMSRLPYASVKGFEWMASDREIMQQMGCLTLCHVLRKGELSERSADELLDQASVLLPARHAAQLLRIFASLSAENEEKVKKVADYLL